MFKIETVKNIAEKSEIRNTKSENPKKRPAHENMKRSSAQLNQKNLKKASRKSKMLLVILNGAVKYNFRRKKICVVKELDLALH